MGAFGIATSVIPVGKVAGVFKVALRAGDKAGDAYDLARTSERIIDPVAHLAVDAANVGGDAVKEAKILKQANLLDIAKRSPVQQRGLDVLGRVENTAVVSRELRENVALVEFVGQLAAKKGGNAAAATVVAKFLHPTARSPLRVLREAGVLMQQLLAGAPRFAKGRAPHC